MIESNKEFDLALFRYGLISQLIHVKDKKEQSRIIDDIISKQYDIPYSNKKKLSKKTIRRYLKAYNQGNFEKLKRKIRKDKNLSRVIPENLIKTILDLKKEEPRRSANKIIDIIKSDPQLKDIKLAERTVSRIFKNNNLAGKTLLPTNFKRRFEMEHINQIWQTDCMDGICIASQNKKTFLIAFIDDYSRLVTHAQFYYDEKLPSLEDCFKKAILKRGIPKKVYADNGKIYVSDHFKIICAELGIELINHAPYSPWSKGKQERFFLTVQNDFLVEAEGANIDSIEQLNSLFQAWLEIKYHRTEHSSINTTPLDRFTQDMKTTKIKKVESLEEITEIFLSRAKRKVHNKQGFISVFGNHYRINDITLINKEIEIRYDPYDLSKVYIYFEKKFIQISFPSSLKTEIMPDIPEENPKTDRVIRKSSIEYFERLKQKELELFKKESNNIDFSKLNKEDKNV